MSELLATDPHGVFNRCLNEFLVDMGAILSDLPEYSTIKNAVKVLSYADKKRSQQLFNTIVVERYRDRIMAKDEKFFMETDYADEVKMSNYAVSLNVIDLIKSVWTNLDDINKTAIWQHMHILVFLNDKCRSS